MTRSVKAELLEALAAETASRATAVTATPAATASAPDASTLRRRLEREEGGLIWAEPQAPRKLKTVDEPSDVAQNWLAIVAASRRLGVR